MKKGIHLLIIVGFVVLAGIWSFVAGGEKAISIADRANAEEPRYIGYAEYAGICMLKDIFPYDVYKDCVRPHVQKLLSKDKITEEEFAEFEQEVDKSLKARGYTVRQRVSALASEESFSDSVQKNINKFNDDASKMGKDIKKGLNNLMDDIGKSFEKSEPKPQPKSTEL